ncbi:hypothetical protein CDAR_557581 [Caerostris darwini]|uniref:Maturase K n=1 Tax=Caerostris darwini TaxID=1538125 RepID=A0AAV4R9R6_9ARAC|nr:hypothetical protein CDAR_557581 [Caerostris darwini]
MFIHSSDEYLSAIIAKVSEVSPSLGRFLVYSYVEKYLLLSNSLSVLQFTEKLPVGFNYSIFLSYHDALVQRRISECLGASLYFLQKSLFVLWDLSKYFIIALSRRAPSGSIVSLKCCY